MTKRYSPEWFNEEIEVTGLSHINAQGDLVARQQPPLFMSRKEIIDQINTLDYQINTLVIQINQRVDARNVLTNWLNETEDD
jgi:hypothetical protein